MIDLPFLALRYRLGLLRAEDLVAIANQLLNEGQVTPALIDLYTLSEPVGCMANPAFERACQELGIRIPSLDEAIMGMIRHHMEAIVAARVTPEEGLTSIMQDVYDPHVWSEPVTRYVGDSRGLETAFGLFHGFADYPEDYHDIEEHARECAREWLATHPEKIEDKASEEPAR